MTRTGRRIVLLTAAALFAAGDAGAQWGGIPGTGRPGGLRSRNGMADKSQQRAPEAPRANAFQTTLEELRIDLKLDAAQQAAWNGFADKLAALLADVARERSRSQPGTEAATLTAPAQFNHLAMVEQNRATAIEDIAASAKSLYEKLSPEQKAVADGRLANVASLVLASPYTGK
jgi:hypothetical protein